MTASSSRLSLHNRLSTRTLHRSTFFGQSKTARQSKAQSAMIGLRLACIIASYAARCPHKQATLSHLCGGCTRWKTSFAAMGICWTLTDACSLGVATALHSKTRSCDQKVGFDEPGHAVNVSGSLLWSYLWTRAFHLRLDYKTPCALILTSVNSSGECSSCRN